MSETCQRMTDLMLEADPAELAGQGESEVARHVVACARCRRAAEAFLAGNAALRSALADAAARHAGDRPRGVRRAPNRLRRLAWRVAVPLAAAAVVVMLRAMSSDMPPSTIEPEPLAARRPGAVQVGSSQPYVVMQTANPKITVVWFY